MILGRNGLKISNMLFFNTIKIKKIIGYLYRFKILKNLRYLQINFYSSKKTSNYNPNVSLEKVKLNINVKKKNLKFLICTISGDNFLIRLFDNLFYITLKLLKIEVSLLKCGKSLPLCHVSNYSLISEIKKDQEKLCELCTKGFSTEFGSYDRDIVNLRDYIDKRNIVKINKLLKKINHKNVFNFKNVPSYINENVQSAFIRFNGSSQYNKNDINNLVIIKEYYKSALIFDYSFKKLLKHKKYNRIISHHGIYIPHGIILSIAKLKKISAYVWQPGYRKNSIVVVKNHNVHTYFPKTKKWNKFVFDEIKQNRIKKYLRSRVNAVDNWLSFNVKINRKTIFKNDNTTYLMALNVDWDAVVHFRSLAFNNMFDWLKFTVDYFTRNPNKNLIIRAHPAELLGNVPSSISAEKYLKSIYPVLPKNIKFINSFSSLNTYDLCKQSDVLLIYSSKISIEIATLGKPVIVSGEGWIKNKNITHDIKSPKEYEILLNKSIKFLNKKSKKNKIKSLKFAYFYFFRKMFKFNNIQYFRNKLPRYKSLILNRTNNIVLENTLIDLVKNMIKNRDT